MAASSGVGWPAQRPLPGVGGEAHVLAARRHRLDLDALRESLPRLFRGDGGDHHALAASLKTTKFLRIQWV